MDSWRRTSNSGGAQGVFVRRAMASSDRGKGTDGEASSPKSARARLEKQLGKLDITDEEATPLVMDDWEEEATKKWSVAWKVLYRNVFHIRTSQAFLGRHGATLEASSFARWARICLWWSFLTSVIMIACGRARHGMSVMHVKGIHELCSFSCQNHYYVATLLYLLELTINSCKSAQVLGFNFIVQEISKYGRKSLIMVKSVNCLNLSLQNTFQRSLQKSFKTMSNKKVVNYKVVENLPRNVIDIKFVQHGLWMHFYPWIKKTDSSFGTPKVGDGFDTNSFHSWWISSQP